MSAPRALVIDSSALLAILLKEPGADAIADRLLAAPRRYVNAATLCECSMVIERRLGPAGTAVLDEYLSLLATEIVPFDVTCLGWARRAFRKFGKGAHAAALNLGDCIAYATAMHLGLPLLFKGDDFPRTDVEPA